MTGFTLSVEGQKSVTGELQLETPAPARLLYRVPHDCERDAAGNFVYGKRDGKARENTSIGPIPQPFRAFPDHPTKTEIAHQELLVKLNTGMTRSRALELLGTGLCWCNGKWGTFHTPILTGGFVVEAVKIESGRVYFKSILKSDPVPTAQEAIDNFLCAWATSTNTDAQPNYMTRPSGYGYRVHIRMFILSEQPLWMPESQLHRLPPGFVPPSVVWMPD